MRSRTLILLAAAAAAGAATGQEAPVTHPTTPTAAAPVTAPGTEAVAGLMPGDPAPAFSLAGSDGRTHTLASLAGNKVVVLAWFPKAFTGG